MNEVMMWSLERLRESLRWHAYGAGHSRVLVSKNNSSASGEVLRPSFKALVYCCECPDRGQRQCV
jgi:hypothetical protein